MDEINIIQESLMMEGRAVGLCLIPDLRDPSVEKKDPMSVFRLRAIIPEQTHSCNVSVVDSLNANLEDTDALITFENDVAVVVKTADCVPILIFTPELHGVGAIHAGWKGTLGGIVDNVMDVIQERGGDPSRLKVAFGPSISKEVYEVDMELAERFVEAGFKEYVSFPYGHRKKPHIDLQGINMERFVRRGVKRGNIKLHSGCSFRSSFEDGSPMYASYRRSGGAPSRMLTCIKLLPESDLE